MQQNPYAPPVANAYPQDPSTIVEPGAKVSVIDSVKFAFSRQVGFGSLAMGLLLTFIPVVGPILLAGWMAESHRRLVRRESPSVRPFVFGEFVQYLTAGLVPFLVQPTLVSRMEGANRWTQRAANLADGTATVEIREALSEIGIVCGN